MSKTYPVSKSIKATANLDEKTFNKMYEDSINNPESFWAKQALLQVDWIKQPTEIISYLSLIHISEPTRP